MVWFAPTPRSSGGRSAVSRMSGDPRHRGLDDRREELGRRGAARAGDRDRLPGRLRQAEPEESRRALVQVHVDVDPPITVQRKGDRGRARAGRDARVLEADSSQARHERAACRRARRRLRRGHVLARTNPKAISKPHAAWVRSGSRQHRDQVTARRRPDDFHRPDRERPRGQTEQRPLRHADAFARDPDRHPHRDRRERAQRRARGRGTRVRASPSRTASVRFPSPRRSGCLGGCSRPGSRRRAGPSADSPTTLRMELAPPLRRRSQRSPSGRRTRRPRPRPIRAPRRAAVRRCTATARASPSRRSARARASSPRRAPVPPLPPPRSRAARRRQRARGEARPGCRKRGLVPRGARVSTPRTPSW